MKFIDSHIHLQDFTSSNATDIIESAQKEGVEKFICIFIKEDEWDKADEIVKQFSGRIIPAFGVYPGDAQRLSIGWTERLEKQLERFPQAMVGEVGLDKRFGDFEKQVKVFARQIELAKKLKRPVLIHAVKADEALDEFWDKMPEVFVFHSFNGRAEMMRKIVKRGGYVSFSFSILGNRDKERVLKEVPVEKILLETDSPYQSIIPNTENTPARLPFLAKEIARIRNQDVKELAAKIYENTERLVRNER